MKRYLGTLVLGAALFAPAMMTAQVSVRIYDRDNKDYHQWNDAEARAHRHWLMEEQKRKTYRAYNRTTKADQRAYWKWRHDHQDWK